MRRMIKAIEMTKKAARYRDLAFGGMSVLVFGNFGQFDPPSGTALASAPGHVIGEARQYPAAPDVREGLEKTSRRAGTIACKV